MKASLDQSINELVRAARVIDYNTPTFTSYGLSNLTLLREMVPITEELFSWYQTAAPTPRYALIPWTVEDLRLYSPYSLIENQIGYRWLCDPHQDELIRRWQAELAIGDASAFPDMDLAETGTWDPNWLVIGDASADPFIAHADQPGTPISHAIHGQGSWSPKIISPDLATFLRIVATWIDVCIGKYKWQLRNEDSIMRSEVITDLDTVFDNFLDAEYKTNLMSFIRDD